MRYTSEGGGREKVVVMMDGIDFMMAALGVGAGEMLEMIGRTREVSFLLHSYFSGAHILLF